MKKILAITLSLILCVALFAGCGGGKTTTGQTEPAAVKGEVYDTGSFSVAVPSGWKALGVEDMWTEEEGDMDPTQVQVYKGADDYWDMFSTPGVTIAYYDADNTLTADLLPEMYDDVTDLEPLELGGRTWQGFSAKSFDSPITILWTGEADSDQFQVSIWTEMSEGSISLDDADVQAIIASITVK